MFNLAGEPLGFSVGAGSEPLQLITEDLAHVTGMKGDLHPTCLKVHILLLNNELKACVVAEGHVWLPGGKPRKLGD